MQPNDALLQTRQSESAATLVTGATAGVKVEGKRSDRPLAARASAEHLPAEGPRAERVAALAWALAHPARVRIVQLLLQRQACVCGEIVEVMPLAQSTVSQHLKILKESGLVQGEVDGPRICYCIDPAVLAELKALVAEL